MLAIWNRKEVMLTNDMERLVKARYAYKVQESSTH